LPTTTNSSHHRDILDASLFCFSNAAGLKNINPRLFLKKRRKRRIRDQQAMRNERRTAPFRGTSDDDSLADMHQLSNMESLTRRHCDYTTTTTTRNVYNSLFFSQLNISFFVFFYFVDRMDGWDPPS
jgi:hypothetical protein